MATELDKLKRELENLKKEFKDFKDGLRTQIISQQNNSRDPFRSDRGDIVLKKNANIKNRKSPSAGYDNVMSTFFNEQAKTGVNVIYIGHDGFYKQRNVQEIGVMSRHNPDLPFLIGDMWRNGSIYNILTSSDEENVVSDTVYMSVKTKYLLGDENNDSNSSLLLGNMTDKGAGLVGIGSWLPDGNLGMAIYMLNGDVHLSPAPGKNIKVGPDEFLGFTGSVSNPTSITVQNGIVIAVGS